MKMINKKFSIALIAIAAIFLTGCDAEEKRRAPETVDVGVFDDCVVKYVDRGYNVNSFYIAKCGSTTTTTNNFAVAQGKTRVARRSTVITQEIANLEAEKAESVKRETALQKLTPEEKASLGIK